MNWLKFFSMTQILIIDGDNLIQNPWIELEKVEKFLNLNHEIDHSMFYFNRTKGFYCFLTGYLSKCLNSSKGRPHPNVSQSVLNDLRKFYSEYNDSFFNLVGYNFSWKSYE